MGRLTMKLSMICVVLAALAAVANAGSIDIKVQDKSIAITPTEDAWQQLVAPLSEGESLRGNGCSYPCKSDSDCNDWQDSCKTCDKTYKKCASQAQAQQAVTAPTMNIVEIQTTGAPVKVGPPCHFIEDDSCKQSKKADVCVMDWEKSGDCDSVGYPVCCSGAYGIELFFAPKTDCNKLVNDRGVHWAKPCSATK